MTIKKKLKILMTPNTKIVFKKLTLQLITIHAVQS